PPHTPARVRPVRFFEKRVWSRPRKRTSHCVDWLDARMDNLKDQGPGTKDQGPETEVSHRSFVPGPLSLVLIVALATIYAWLIYKHGSPFAAGSDSSGYLNSARLLAAGQCSIPARE